MVGHAHAAERHAHDTHVRLQEPFPAVESEGHDAADDGRSGRIARPARSLRVHRCTRTSTRPAATI
jgi:hypothetical protein